jgi:hypothetical protein
MIILLIYFSLLCSRTDYTFKAKKIALLFAIILPLSIVEAKIMIYMQNDIIGFWHIYYNIQAIEYLMNMGNIQALQLIKGFDNFVSAPALPVWGGIYTLITSLSPDFVVKYTGLVVYIATVILQLVLLMNFLTSGSHYSTIEIVIPGLTLMVLLTSFVPPYLNYSLHVLLFNSMILYLLSRMRQYASKIDYIVTTITFLSYVFYYFPGFLITIMVFVMPFIMLYVLVRVTNQKYIHFNLRIFTGILFVALSIALFYFSYMAYAFYFDLKYAIKIILTSMQLQPIVIYHGKRLESLDLFAMTLLQLSRIKVVSLLAMILIGVWLFFKSSDLFIKILALQLCLLSPPLILPYFVSVATDYSLRFYVLVSPLLPAVIYVFMHSNSVDTILTSNRRNNTSKIISRVLHIIRSKHLKAIIMTIIFAGFMYADLFSSFIVFPVPKSVSENSYGIVDSFTVSEFIAENLDPYFRENSMIVGNYRYGYVESIYDLKYEVLSTWFLENISNLLPHSNEYLMLLVLSRLSLFLPDRYCDIINNNTWQYMYTYFPLIYNSCQSFTFLIRSY